MNKIDAEQIIEYYSQDEVVNKYDERRFAGQGGKYVMEIEVRSNLDLLCGEIKPSKKMKILDVGAGTGRFSVALKKKGFDVFCLDSSPEMVQTLRKTFPPNRILKQSAFDKVEVKEKFSAITALRFFDHFGLRDQRKLLNNLNRSLDKNGLIVFSVLNKVGLEYLLSKIAYFGKVNFYYKDSDFRKLFKFLHFRVLWRQESFFIPRGVFLYVHSHLILEIFKLLDRSLTRLFSKYCSSYVYLLKKE